MTDDDYAMNEQTSKQHWEDLLRKMLPAGAPLPDEDQLDYSISIEYQPPTHPHNNLNQPIDRHSLSGAITPIPIIKNPTFTKPPKTHHKYTGSTSNLTAFVATPVSDTGEDEISNVPSFDTTQEEEKEKEKEKEKEEEEEEEEEEEDNDSSASVTASPVVEASGKRNQKKSICSRCGNGNRLKEKEGCIVCDARYCSNCLLKAMGSMPEGRKCVGCIGKPIDESIRQRLGKCSRMLSKVCSPLEVRQIMMAEKECFANQLRPEQLVVNGRQLRQEDLSELLSCHDPPLKLKPGKYWYDKDSGLWGQEGEKPDRIVTSKLNVGGKLQMDASNGNTQVYINGRQITKLELRVLKLAKVQCPHGTHFWLYDDGSYEEEGQNNIKGNIWGKASTRFISSLFCLPVPHEPSQGSNHDSTTFLSRSITQNLEHSRVHKLMLFGLEGSGTSTIFKQARFLYGHKFSGEELQHLKHMIQSNTYRYLSVLLEGRERFEEEDDLKSVYSFKPKFKHFSDWLLDIMAMGDFENYFPAATREYAPLVDEIWKDPAIQETYKRRDELNFLPDVAKYFLDRTIELSSNDYEPSENDILYVEGVTPSNGVSYLDFSFHDHSPMSETDNENGQSPLIKFQLIRMSTKGKLEEWLDMFEDARLVVFCVALSDYDQVSPHTMENKMLASRDSFERLAKQPCFADVPFVLILNKYDVFEEKIGRTPLSVCEWFSDFRPPLKAQHNQQSVANQAYYYVGIKFKEVYAGITGKKLFVWKSVGRERGYVDGGFRNIREVIRWDEEREEDVYGIININDDDTFYTTQT